MKTKSNICPNCEKEFILRRSDQKYCTSKCRSRYHNKNNVINLEIVKKTNTLLLKVYKLLLVLMGDKKVIEVSGEYLRSIGFSFEVHTHFELLDGKKEAYIGVYDFYYFKTKNNNYKIFRV